MAQIEITNESAPKDIRSCPSVKVINELLVTLNQSQKRESEIASAVQREHPKYTKPQIDSAINDVKKRLKWNIQSTIHCLVYVQSEKQWTDGVIVDISADEKTEEEVLTVNYGDSKTKEFNRLSSELKPIGIDNKECIPNEEIMEYIAQRFKAVQGVGDLEKKYSVVPLLDALNYVKYEHGVDENDEKFDEIFAFFQESMTGFKCDVNECEHVRRHYTYRRRRQKYIHIDHHQQELLLDIIAMIHCYFVHSFEIDRLTKEERQRIEAEAHDERKQMTTITNILIAKRKKLKFAFNGRRYDQETSSEDDDQKSTDKSVDFITTAEEVEMDGKELKKSMKEYVNDRDRLISDLIDVVYGEEEKSTIWDKLKMENKEKREKFRMILFVHFTCTDLNKGNFLKISKFVIERKKLQIDAEELYSSIFDKSIDGNVFSKMSAQEFCGLLEMKSNSDHVVELYTVLKQWRYVANSVDFSEPQLNTVSSRKIQPLAVHEATMESVTQSIAEIKADKESKPSALKAAKMEKFSDQFIQFFIDRPHVDGDALSIMPQEEFARQMAEHCDSKAVKAITSTFRTAVLEKMHHDDSPMVILVRQVLNDVLMERKAKSNVNVTEKYGSQILKYFRTNPDVDDFSKIAQNELGRRLAEHCGINKVKGIATYIRRMALKKLAEAPKEDEKQKEADVYEIGKRFVFWNNQRNHKDFVNPKYDNIKDEILHGAALSGLVSNKKWDDLTQKVLMNLETKKAKRIKSNGHMFYTFGIESGEPFDERHLRALKLYTDLTEFCKKFCEILREGDPEKVAEIAHFTKSLIETVQCFGSAADVNDAKTTYYRGVNRTFMFRVIVSTFHLPQSTTSSVK